jgi:hypothetical protein
LLDQRKALLCFANANPDAGVHVAIAAGGHLERQIVIGRIGEVAAGIEVAP